MQQPLLSIVIPTLNRVIQVEALLQSIILSDYENYEVLVIDQNFSNILDSIIYKFSDKITIRQFKVDFRGAAKARNFGIKHANGHIICFPDDDCEVFPDTFSKAVDLLESTQSNVLFGKCVERDLSDSVINFEKKAGYLTCKKYEGMFIEASIFIRHDICSQYQYDEALGVGKFHGAEEGHDLVLRILKDKIKIFYSPEVIFYHPGKVLTYTSPEEIRRVFTYRCGFSRLCLKHQLYIKLIKRLSLVTAYLPYLVLFKHSKIRYYLAEIMGLLSGMVVR